MRKLEKLIRDSEELHADSVVLHVERKYVPGPRVNFSKS
jgi:hypothetical protein